MAHEDKQTVYTPPPVTGYRQLTQHEVDLMNRVKAAGDELGQVTDDLRMDSSVDHRWLAIGVTQAQQAIMAIVRAIAKPTNF